MVTTTDDGDDGSEKKAFDRDALARAMQAARIAGENSEAQTVFSREALTWLNARGHAGADQHVVQSAGEVHNVFIGAETSAVASAHIDNVKSKPSLAEQRQKFHFDFLNHSLKQAEWTFRLSVWFMTGGAAVILVGAVLALFHAGSPNHGYLPLVTSLTGALITVGGGALAVHARRARAHVTEQAERIENKIDLDHQLETATTFIDRVQDKDAKDRLNAAAAMKALDMQATPETMVNRLLPDRQAKEIEPGDSAT
ncbi:TRADD-N-associated membrane domain-containing protein [Streptomyces mirabilis]|uniref:TRADD-N-associated membrane domain-containing protein n=1 Tax=Streptomyces mirabilis TaxID=68239 RepID=UPI00365BE460